MDKPDEPKKKWAEMMGAFGREVAKLGGDFQKAIRDASESEVGKQVKQVLAEVGPHVKRAAQAVGPEIQKVVEQVRPDVERAVGQLRPEVERIVGEARPVIQGALNDLFGHKSDDTSSTPSASAHPNISPDVAPAAGDDDDEEHTPADGETTTTDAARPQPRRSSAGSNRAGAPTKTIGRKPKRKPDGESGA